MQASSGFLLFWNYYLAHYSCFFACLCRKKGKINTIRQVFSIFSFFVNPCFRDKYNTLFRVSTISPFKRFSVFVDFTPMPHGQGKNNKLCIIDLADQAVISNPIPPLPATVRCQPFSVLPWVCAVYQIFFNPRLKHALCIVVELFEILIEPGRRFNTKIHIPHSFQSSAMGELLLPLLTYSS